MPVLRGFRTSEAARLTRLSVRQLDYWDRTGFIRPSLAAARGRGSARFYSFRDLVCLRVAGELRSAGVSLSALRKVVDCLKRELGVQDPLSTARLVVCGNDVLLVKGSEELVSVLKSPGQGVLKMVLDLPRLVEDLDREAAALEMGA